MKDTKVMYCKLCGEELVRVPPIEGGRASAGMCVKCGMCYARITNASRVKLDELTEKQLKSLERTLKSSQMRELQLKVVDVLNENEMEVPPILLAKDGGGTFEVTQTQEQEPLVINPDISEEEVKRCQVNITYAELRLPPLLESLADTEKKLARKIAFYEETGLERFPMPAGLSFDEELVDRLYLTRQNF